MGSRGLQADIIENWAVGVITSVLPDRLPDGAVPASKNSQFYNIGPQTAIFGTRRGCELQNEEAATDAIVSQYFLNTDGDDFHLVVDGEGNLTELVDGEFEEVAETLFEQVDNPFSWQTANNMAFVVNGEEQYKTDGVDVYSFGILQPEDGDWSVAAISGGGDLPAGDYNVVISYYNSTTGHEGPESEPKPITIAAGQQIEVTIPTDGDIDDPQVDYVKIYMEQSGVRNDFFLVIDGTDPAITDTSGWPTASTTTVEINTAQESIDVFRLLSPGVNNYYPPPSDAKFIINHRSRMFALTDNNVYWSDVDKPEAFNTVDHYLPVGEEDGELITGCAVLSDSLIIFKRNAIYALVGEAPESWEVVLIDKTVGCVSYNSIGYFDNKLFWMSLKGPQMWNSVDSGVVDITTELIGPTFDEEHIDPDLLSNSVIIGHPVQNYVAWAITPLNESQNTVIIPFNFKLQRWMASEWNIVDVRSCAIVTDSDGRQWPMLGDYYGWIFKLGVSDADGLPSGVASSGLVDSSTSTVLTDVDLDLDSDVLIGRYVYVWDDVNGVRNAQRRRISTNTATTLTVEPAFTRTPVYNDHYAIGGVLLDWRSAFRNGGVPFFKKRIEFLFIELTSSSEGTTCDVELYKDMDTAVPVMSRTVTIGDGALWDAAIWDVDEWAGGDVGIFRIPVRTVGYNWQTRVVHMSTGEQLSIYRNAVQWQTKTKKTGLGT